MSSVHSVAENIARHLLLTSSSRSTKDRELESLFQKVHDSVSPDVFQSIILIILDDTRPAANRLFPLIMQHNVSVGSPVPTNQPFLGNNVCENIDEDANSNMSNILNNIDNITCSSSRGRHSRLEARVD